jgi:hypothetical protein
VAAACTACGADGGTAGDARVRVSLIAARDTPISRAVWRIALIMVSSCPQRRNASLHLWFKRDLTGARTCRTVAKTAGRR